MQGVATSSSCGTDGHPANCILSHTGPLTKASLSSSKLGGPHDLPCKVPCERPVDPSFHSRFGDDNSGGFVRHRLRRVYSPPSKHKPGNKKRVPLRTPSPRPGPLP